jgi:hydroxymethylbilane synthase
MVKGMRNKKLIIGTRGSKLALWQAEFVRTSLQKLHAGLAIELNKIKTTGDKILDVPLAQVGGKGLFVKEIEEALLRHEADIAVHSMKDVPTEFPEGLHLAVICEREDPRDAFISSQKKGTGPRRFQDLPSGAKIGTSSLRRSCQILHIRPDLRIEQLRGNLDTRLRKLDEGQYDAVILASAGVKRLGLQHRLTEILPYEISLPAIGQGAIGIECRTNDDFISQLISPLNHLQTQICVTAERAFLKRLEGGCQVPIAAHARLEQNKKGSDPGFLIVMDGLVGSISGDRIIKSHIEGRPEDATSLGIALAEDVLSRGAKEILHEVYSRNAPSINGEIRS